LDLNFLHVWSANGQFFLELVLQVFALLQELGEERVQIFNPQESERRVVIDELCAGLLDLIELVAYCLH
jgi:hypothetical protein